MKHIIFALTIFSPSVAIAESPTIVGVESRTNGGTWSFDVQLLHADEGWDHYADGWGIYLPDGTELGYRILAHPHVNEQPFTRSLNGVEIPNGVDVIIIKPRDSVHGVGEDFIHKLNK